MGGISTGRHLLDTQLRSGVLRVRAPASLIHVKASLVHSGPARANVNIHNGARKPHLVSTQIKSDRFWNEWAKVVRRILRAAISYSIMRGSGR